LLAVDRPDVKQRIDHRAFGNPVAAALARHFVHRPLETPQIGDLAADRDDVINGEF
jgi:hypothetical protein